jgi:hypothetical protein
MHGEGRKRKRREILMLNGQFAEGRDTIRTGGDGSESVLGDGEEVLGHGPEVLYERERKRKKASASCVVFALRILPPSSLPSFLLPSIGKRPTNLDQRKMQPEALSLGGEVSSLLEGLLHEGEVGSLEEGSGGSDGVRRVGDDDVEGVLDGGKVLKTVGDVDGDLGVGEDGSHSREVLGRDSGDGLKRSLGKRRSHISPSPETCRNTRGQ